MIPEAVLEAIEAVVQKAVVSDLELVCLALPVAAVLAAATRNRSPRSCR